LKEEFNKKHTEGPNLPLETDASKSAVKGDTITKLPNKSSVKRKYVKKSPAIKSSVKKIDSATDNVSKKLKRVKSKYNPDGKSSNSSIYGEIVSSSY
jgi:hypothetical protein